MRPEIQLQRDTIATVTRYNCNRIRYQTPLGYNEIQLQPDTTATDTTATGYNCNTGGLFCNRIQRNEIQLGLFGGSVRYNCHRIQAQTTWTQNNVCSKLKVRVLILSVGLIIISYIFEV